MRTKRTYDPRLKELVRNTGNPSIAFDLGIPRSTVMTWMRSSSQLVVTAPALVPSELDLAQRVVELEHRVRKLLALLQLLVAVLRLCGVSLRKERVPDPASKARLLRVIKKTRQSLPLRVALRAVRISASRYNAWKRAQDRCELGDRPSCPRTSPQQLTALEVRVIREMVTSSEYCHVPTGRLAWLAQRMGKVYASASTWHRLIRRNGLRRPRTRHHPRAPREGICASTPDEAWHVDTTVIRLLDGTKAYLHAVIDNYSRRILGWQVNDRFDPCTTINILQSACEEFGPGSRPTVLVDGGVENFNQGVDELVERSPLRRVLAQTEIRFSNSMIEAWWRTLKHQWLFLNELDSVGRLRSLVEFYVGEHNSRLPHAAFQGQTPDEMYFGTGSHVPGELAQARQEARDARMEANRSVEPCRRCPREVEETEAA